MTRSLLALTTLIAALYLVSPIGDPDLWWHIVAGRWMLTNGRIPHQDLWGLFSTGQPWRAYSWSLEVIFAAVEWLWSFRGLFMLQVILAFIFSGSICSAMVRMSKDSFFGGVIALLVTVSVFSHFTLRPQVVVWIYFAWLIFISHRISTEGFTLRRGFGLALVMCLWANAHITTILGLMTVCLWIWGDRPVRVVAASLGFAFLGTLVTPYFGGEWLTFFGKSGHPLNHSIVYEFRPANIREYHTAFTILLGAVFVAFLLQQRAAIKPGKLLLAAIFTFGGFTAIKFLPFANIVLGSLIALLWRNQHEQLSNLAQGICKLREGLERAMKPATWLVLLLLVAVTNGVRVSKMPRLDIRTVPQGALDFIIDQGIEGPYLNDFNTGGYLVYRFADSAGESPVKATLDGRTNLITPELWEKHLAAFTGAENWRDYVDLVNPNAILWRNEGALTQILIASKEWCRVYRDGDAKGGYSVLVKYRDGEPCPAD